MSNPHPAVYYRYRIKVLARRRPGLLMPARTQEMKCDVTATGDLEARRLVLERAWSGGLSVVRFVTIAKVRMP